MLAVDGTVHGRHGPVPVRRYSSTAATADAGQTAGLVVWVHGGAFSHGGLDQPESHAVGLELATEGFPVVTVDYRKVPAWSWWRKTRPGILDGIRYPDPLEDVIDVVLSLRAEDDTGTPLILGGASAGACLSAGAARRLLDEEKPGPDRLMLAYGTFHSSLPPASRQLRARIRGRHALAQFRAPTVDRMNRNYAGRIEAMGDKHAFPGGHDLTRMPPTLCLDADRDSLRASGELFAHELNQAGSLVRHEVVPESAHGFLNRPGTATFDDGIRRMIRWLRSGASTQGNLT